MQCMGSGSEIVGEEDTDPVGECEQSKIYLSNLMLNYKNVIQSAKPLF